MDRGTTQASQCSQSLVNLDAVAPIGFRYGAHRTVAPAETLARVRRFMPVMGITRVANVTGLDCVGIPVVMVCRPNSRSLSVAQGKGADLPSAQASGLMESIESYHAEHITLPLKLNSLEELQYTHRLVDVDIVPRVRNSRFHRHRPIHWVEGYDLLHAAPVWLPYDLVHTNFTESMRRVHGGFVMSSNGLASGNHILEAVSHGICEVVERDAGTLWRLLDADGHEATRIDLDTVGDPLCRSILDRYANAGVAVAVWEITSDVGIPAFLCHVARDEHMWHPMPAEGMGCHPVRSIALLRALVEAAQSRLTFIAGARDDLTWAHYRKAAETTAPRPTMTADSRGQRPFGVDSKEIGETLNGEVAWELACLARAGIESVIVVDLTKPEFRLPVVRVVIPGLETHSKLPGYAPGRRAVNRLGQHV